ncbi:BMP family ABC transporter substrate-binding protein [Fictibacillus aquaticus]|uniref:BMP family ABC transporter substrate-binding protein n=1 Tax=Fictibacillus aquaticus TaxID=2021314 RepID=A0A235FCW8_9BACL|nr:BMP family ABC transporter substrate-binding protein [Fictibacillus aquaticus]OYD59082.1 BMP family ABC transporter substrate-binding protein [Fictibacillus aquaticus]
MKWLAAVMSAVLLILSGCSSYWSDGKLENAGILIEDTINDQGWGTKGYKGLLAIQEEFNNDVLYKENIKSKEQALEAVKEFKKNNVNLIFGHGKIYSEYFRDIAKEYPDIHFVSFNGTAEGKNVTSLTFNSYAMGFFAGMLAGKMSKTNEVGVIGAMEWQPEIRGYEDGAAFAGKKVSVHTSIVKSWSDKEKALNIFEKLKRDKVDVIYPAGDGFAIPVIEKAKEDGLYSIGYVSDHSDIGKTAVLTSTVQHVDKLYLLTAKKFNEGKLKSGNLSFDFKEGVVALGKFSPLVPEKMKKQLQSDITQYKKSGKLPSGDKPTR